jgi:type IV secretory pathway protease TraF
LCVTISMISTPGRRCREAEANMAEPAKHRLHWPGLSACAAAFSTLGLAGTLVSPPRPFLLWNASASSPVGLYVIERGRIPRMGEMAIAWLPPSGHRLAAIRNYLPARVPLVKPVAAVSGSRICAIGSAILVNGRLAALRRTHDSTDRPMPWWSGCERLGKGDLLLLSPDASAFDGRYFGVTRARDVVGTARLLWRR